MTTSNRDWIKLQKKFTSALTKPLLQKLAEDWAVSSDVLSRLRIGWSVRKHAYTFPECDYSEQIVGIMYRGASTGKKWMFPGSHRGAYLANGWRENEGPILLPEGVSDTATLLAHDIAAVGRPSCAGGIEVLAEILRDTDREILVVGENDEKDGRWPGREGARTTAQKLADQLNREVRWTLPPDGFKDVRDWFNQGGQHAQ